MIYDFDEKVEYILNKKFKSKIHAGYDPDDVDSFFDEMITYIQDVKKLASNCNHEIKEREKIIAHLKDENSKLKNANKSLQEQVNKLNAEGYSNIDIIESNE